MDKPNIFLKSLNYLKKIEVSWTENKCIFQDLFSLLPWLGSFKVILYISESSM